MAWLADNWFWVLVLIAFVAMHLFGHGGHGGHGGGRRQQSTDDQGKGDSPARGAGPRASGHQH
jgi:hypothetical protein